MSQEGQGLGMVDGVSGGGCFRVQLLLEGSFKAGN